VSSQAVWELASGGAGALLVSPFNVKWGCYAWAGGVEESKFCLFSVVFPARCISSVSLRFYFRKHAFCFLPLATILESTPIIYFEIRKYNALNFFLLFQHNFGSLESSLQRTIVRCHLEIKPFV
jgi:hypothetical protein